MKFLFVIFLVVAALIFAGSFLVEDSTTEQDQELSEGPSLLENLNIEAIEQGAEQSSDIAKKLFSSVTGYMKAIKQLYEKALSQYKEMNLEQVKQESAIE